MDILGYPAAMPELERLAAKSALGMLEDACEALGAVDSEGVRVGARGNLATFAFYANKQLTTAEGGVIVPSSAGIAARMRSERNQGRSPDMGWLAHERLGFNYRLTDLQAAIGVAQLERVEELLAARAGVAALYGERLGAIGGSPAGEGDPDGLVLPCADRGAERRSWFIYAVLLPAGADRDAVLGELARHGIEAKAYMPCIHLLPALSRALRPPRGPVPGGRGRILAPGRAAVLRRDGRGTGRARDRGARGGAGRLSATGVGVRPSPFPTCTIGLRPCRSRSGTSRRTWRTSGPGSTARRTWSSAWRPMRSSSNSPA